MYLHLGNQVIALQKSVLGVFDMDTATWSHRTRETLEKWEQAGQVENAAGKNLLQRNASALFTSCGIRRSFSMAEIKE